MISSFLFYALASSSMHCLKVLWYSLVSKTSFIIIINNKSFRVNLFKTVPYHLNFLNDICYVGLFNVTKPKKKVLLV